jgi:hypothetical protein
MQVLGLAGGSPDDLIQLANRNRLNETELFEYIFNNPEFKQQMHDEKIQQLVEDA